MKSPAFPPAFMCRHSSSISKFSYCLSVLRNPVGTPVETIIASRTVKVPDAQLTFTQPERSLPLNSATGLSSPTAGDQRQQIESRIFNRAKREKKRSRKGAKARSTQNDAIAE